MSKGLQETAPEETAGSEGVPGSFAELVAKHAGNYETSSAAELAALEESLSLMSTEMNLGGFDAGLETMQLLASGTEGTNIDDLPETVDTSNLFDSVVVDNEVLQADFAAARAWYEDKFEGETPSKLVLMESAQTFAFMRAITERIENHPSLRHSVSLAEALQNPELASALRLLKDGQATLKLHASNFRNHIEARKHRAEKEGSTLSSFARIKFSVAVEWMRTRSLEEVGKDVFKGAVKKGFELLKTHGWKAALAAAI